MRMPGACPTSQGRERKPEGSWLFTKVPTGDSQVTAPRRDPAVSSGLRVCAPVHRPPGEADEDSDFFSLESVPLLARALAILRVCVVGQWRICGTSVTRWSKSYSNFFSSSPKHILLFPLPILEIESLKWRGRKAFLKSSS